MSDPSPGKWQRLSKEPFFQAPYYLFSHDRYRLPDGTAGDYYYLDIPGASMTVPLLDPRTLVMVRQYRYLMQRGSLEFPAGGMRGVTDPLENARKELAEEAGYAADRWRALGTFAPYNGASNEMCHVYLASDLRPAPPAPGPTEEFEILRVPLQEVPALIRGGEIWDGQTITAFTLYELYARAQPA